MSVRVTHRESFQSACDLIRVRSLSGIRTKDWIGPAAPKVRWILFRYFWNPVTQRIVPKGVTVEGEEAGDVAALGFLHPPRLPRYLGGVVERGQRHEVLGSLLFERQNIAEEGYFTDVADPRHVRAPTGGRLRASAGGGHPAVRGDEFGDLQGGAEAGWREIPVIQERP